MQVRFKMRRASSLLYSVGIWLFAGGFYALVRFYGTHESSDWITSDRATILIWALGSTLFGVTYWLSQQVANSRRFRQRSYGFLILFKALALVGMTVVMVLITRISAYLLGNISPEEIVPTFLLRLSSKPVLIFSIYVFVTAAIAGFISQMRMMIGSRVLWDLMRGKYHHPQQETRIFMFLDLKSSTELAETLGHIKFSRLIRDCFSDLTDSALRHDVEIYQYVGDEAVLTWRIDDGVLNSNCLFTYFDFVNSLHARRDYYIFEYGLMPNFKAGVNLGPVTVAEIGLIKREIAYHGEAIITASRIEGCCNDYAQNLLVSESLKGFVDADNRLRFTPMGRLTLKGKSQETMLYAVDNVIHTSSGSR